MELCGKDLENEVKSKKNQITDLLLADMFSNLVCSALEAKYYSKATTLSKLEQTNSSSKVVSHPFPGFLLSFSAQFL